MSSEQLYRDGVVLALAGFQLLEDQLKNYLDVYYSAVRFLLAGRLSFEFARADINEAPLERLLTNVDKCCANKDLIKRVRSLVKKRNDLAHKAFLVLYGPRLSDSEMAVAVNDFHSVASELHQIMGMLLDETSHVSKVLQQ
jgi:hypothetical protein